jgi:hypothetical protein
MNTLSAAVSLALDLNLTHSLINIREWAATYGATVEELKTEWERQQSERSLKPSNSFETDGK